MERTVSRTDLGLVPPKSRTETGNPNSKQQSSTTHSDWRIVNQMRAIKQLAQQHFGIGSILGTLAIVIAIGAPAVKQGEINGTTTRAVEALSKEQAANQAANEKALSDAVVRIEAGIKEAVDLGKENRADVRAMRDSVERRLGLVEQKSDSNWNLMVDLRTRIGQAEIEMKRREK